MPKDTKTNLLEALPKSSWYRTSNGVTDCVTIQHPSTSTQHNEHKKQIRVPNTVSWRLTARHKLTAWHKITNQQRVMPIKSYDKRAKDIYDVIQQTKTESGDASLYRAADKTLPDKLIDDWGCTTELFSNILNTYHRFPERRALYAHLAFPKRAKLDIEA